MTTRRFERFTVRRVGAMLLAALALGVSTIWMDGRETVQAASLTVDSAGDEPDANPVDSLCQTRLNTCTLRAAIEEINASGGAAVGFDGAYLIQPATPLPEVLNAITIDGTTSGSVVTLDGQFAGVAANGLVLSDGLNIVLGMVIVRFAGSGIVIDGIDGESVVTGNFIGTDTAGGASLGNGVGITIDESPSNTIGGASAADRNVISGNTQAGVLITNAADGNVLEGNFIGTKPSGLSALANGTHGVQVINSSDNKIGTTDFGNVISGNSQHGILLTQGGMAGIHSGTRVQNNLIGLDADGQKALGNGKSGIRTFGIVSDLLIGGTTAAARNIISGNAEHGVESAAAGGGTRLIQGNYIGTDNSGFADLGNGMSGVYSEGNNLTVGGTAAGAGNVISGNTMHGIIAIIRDIRIHGNIIGLTADGATALGNGQNGILLSSTQAPSEIGSATGAGRNIISGNAGHGISLVGAGDPEYPGNASIFNNYIGTDVTGTLDRGNGGSGIRITASNNSNIGGGAGFRNVLSGNAVGGVYVSQSQGNTIGVNYIGTNAAGTGDLGNDGNGVTIDGGSDNTIGSAGGVSVISGNSNSGVALLDTTQNTVRSSYIGTNAAGLAAIPNDYGVALDGSSSNTIGGAAIGSVISGNTWSGVALGEDNNTVSGNIIGLGSDGGTVIANGIGISALGTNHTIGGVTQSERNIVSGNTSHGVLLSGTQGVTVQNTFIGTAINGSSPRPNGGHGMLLKDGTQNTYIGASTTSGPRNIIAYNVGDGIRVDGFVTIQNQILGNDVLFNGGKGIENLAGGNTELTSPIVATASATGASGVSSCANCVVRVHTGSPAEGGYFAGSTVADGGGAWTFVGALFGPNVSATVTDGAANTSEFSTPDTDGDGCSDAEEDGLDPKKGGDRNRFDPWDFYDVNGNRIIDLLDTLEILDHFGQKQGDVGYDQKYNRIALDAAKPWRTSAATGFIDLIDALTSLDSFGHDCSGPP